MQTFESGGALAVRPSVLWWRKIVAATAITLAAVTLSPAVAVYLLLVG